MTEYGARNDLDGEEPNLIGLVCDEIVAVQFWYEGQLKVPVNVAHLRFGGAWFRLYFDLGIIFWGAGGRPEGDFEAPEIRASYRQDDIGRRHGFVGLTLASIESRATEHGAEVLLRFDGGRTLTFFDENDRSDYAC